MGQVPLKSRDVERALTTKGFKPTERDHHFYFLWHNGKKTSIHTKISHGDREIHDNNCACMSRQIHLSRSDFDRFVDCALTEAQYIEKLVNENRLTNKNV